MSMYQQFKTNEADEKNGVWIDYGEFRVRIARAGGANKDFQKALERLARPFRRAIATDSLPAEKAEEMLRAAYAKAVIRAWETKVDGEFMPGIESPEGGDLLEPNEENILATLQALPDLYADLKDQAGSWALFKSALREEASGN